MISVGCSLMPLKVQNQLFKLETVNRFLSLEILSKCLEYGAITMHERHLGKVLNLFCAVSRNLSLL
jgi:hypothetical protein